MIRWTMVGVLLLAAGLLLASFLGVPGFVDQESPIVSTLFRVWPVAYLAVTVAVVVDAVRLVRRGDRRTLAQAVIAVKLAVVPFLACSAVVSTIASALMVASFGPFGVPIIIGLVVLTTVLMLPSSVYGIAAVARLRRDGTVDAGIAAILVLLHLVLVADVVASLVVARMLRTSRPAQAPDPNDEWAAYARLQQRRG